MTFSICAGTETSGIRQDPSIAAVAVNNEYASSFTGTDIPKSLPVRLPVDGSPNGDAVVISGAIDSHTDTHSHYSKRLLETLPGIQRQYVQRSNRERFDVLAKWEGIVLEIQEDSFTARLVDLSGDYPEEEAEFDIEDVSPDDRSLLMAGAGFYWTLGYQTRPNGQRVRVSVVRFRRLPVWTSEEIAAARQWARNVAKLLRTE